MSDLLPTCQQTTCEATPSAISSLASADGASPSDSPDGPMTDLFGRAVVLVSPSVVRENLGGGPIRAIFGQRGIASSASAALQSCLVSRLKQRLGTAGSTLFVMTWKVMATPSGRSVYLLRASGRRTSDNGCGSWRTPLAKDDSRGSMDPICLAQQGHQITLRDQVTLASGWPTPPVNDDNQSRMSEEASLREIARPNAGQSLALSAVLSAWPSPKAQNANGAGLHGQGGQDLQTMASWATPTTRDHKDGSSIGTAPENALLGRQVWQTHGQTSFGSRAETAKPGQLNPAFSRWLMGYPPGWDACAVTATPSSRKPLRRSLAPISTSKP